jgi:hypothetical protein
MTFEDQAFSRWDAAVAPRKIGSLGPGDRAIAGAAMSGILSGAATNDGFPASGS